MDTSVSAANQVVSVGADIGFVAGPKFLACLVRLMLVMVVFSSAFRCVDLSTPLISLFLLVLILLWMPTLNFLPVWFAFSLLRFRLPSRLPFFQTQDGIPNYKVTGVQTCALPI